MMGLFSYHGITRHRGLLLDFANFYDAGRKAALGQFDTLYDPFALIGGADPFGNMSFVSAPISSFAYIPLSGLEPVLAATIFKIIATASLFGALILLFLHLSQRFCDKDDRVKFFAIFSVCSLFYMPFWQIYWIGGQTTPMVLLLLLIALILYGKGQAALPAAVLVLAVAIKPFLAPGLVLLLILAETRLRLALVVIGSVVAAISVLAVGIEPHMAFVRKILSESDQLQAPQLNSNMLSWIEPLFLSIADYETLKSMPSGLKLMTIALRLLLVGVLIALYIRLRRASVPGMAKRHFLFIIAIFTALIVTPVAWAHYLSFLFIVPMFVFANGAHFPKWAKIFAAAMIVISVFQHPFLLKKITVLFDAGAGGYLGIGNWNLLMLMSAIRSVPMILAFCLVTIWFTSFIRSYQQMQAGRVHHAYSPE